jgi:hypothetical protein
MKNGGVGRLANVRRWFQTVAIDACLFLNFAVIFYQSISVSRLVKTIY